uniref:venom phosphodiesterase 2-like n=1 Tax=Styela clava TaxID=7725 RepID=UPI00193A6EC4|nr:venom phosphodiesterase 2-like [Styela clava]
MEISLGTYAWFTIICLAWSVAVDGITKDKNYFCEGECDVIRAECSCEASCTTNKSCCTDYEYSCIGGKSWKDSECTAEDKMKCPDGYDSPHPLLVLSIDGFRDIYLNRNLTPTLSKIASCGVKTPYMISAYPTKTFPNHYTLATGLYPESHGIVSNTMYDFESGEKFRPGRKSSFSPHWWKGEPIWVSASNQGLKSATYFWVGGEINITRYPDYWLKYDQSSTLEKRAHKVLEWLDMPKETRPSVIMLYSHYVDAAGHDAGPFSTLVNESLVYTDLMLEMIMNGLRDRNLDTCVNFIITSDHGMAPIDCKNKLIYLEDYGLKETDYSFDTGAVVRIQKSLNKSLWPRYNPLELKKKLECMRNETHWEAYLTHEYLPKKFHYANNEYIGDVHLVVDDKWWITETRDDPDCEPGGHGYDNDFTDMRAFFAAHGPSFKRGYTKKLPFGNIEMYNLMADLLGLNAAPNNGTEGSLYDILVNPKKLLTESFGLNPESCVYPNIDSSSTNMIGCQPCQMVSTEQASQRLNMNNEQANAYMAENMLYGRPRIFKEQTQYCILSQSNYITTYDNNLKMPIISSFVLNNDTEEFSSMNLNCARRDIRVNENSNINCSASTDLTWTFLFSPRLVTESNQQDVTISSNMIPVYKPFSEIWQFMAKSFVNWAQMYNGISVHVGPIFDYNYDGHADSFDVIKRNGNFVVEDDINSTAIPTHYFIIATRCRDQMGSKSIQDCAKSMDEIEVLNFIIPNFKEAPCHTANSQLSDWVPEAISKHVARMKDIELLSEISFFTSWLTNETTTQEDMMKVIQTKLILPETSQSWVQDFILKTDNDETTESPVTTTSSSEIVSKSNLVLLFLSLLVWIYNL